MMRRRMGRRGLVGTMARTAVVAGTATAVVGGVRNSQQNKAAAEQQSDATQSQAEIAELQQAPPAAVPVALPSATDDLIAQLQKLAALKEAGALDDAEFAAAKAKILG
jgi:hypothetical protein